MKPLVIHNRSSGRATECEAELHAAFEERGFLADFVAVPGHSAKRAAEKALEEGRSLIIAAGGDGTISAVAEAIADRDVTLGILPLGTLNHFARDLGIPLRLDKAVDLLAKGRTRRVDLGSMNGSVFINNSAIGLYPLMVLDRESQQRRLGRSKRLAMVVASLKVLARFDHHSLVLKANDETRAVTTPLLFIGNNDYELEIGKAGKRRSLADGHLCVFVMRSNSRLGLVTAALNALFNRSDADDMLKLEDVTRLVVNSRKSALQLSMDGEVRTVEPPLEFRIRPGALKVVVP